MAKRVPLFETDRLTCYALTVDDYESFASGSEPFWGSFTNPYRHLIEGPSPMVHRIPRVAANPEFAEIGIVLAVLKVSNEVIGSAGFHDLPDAHGMIEIGFGIVDEMQNQGFGRELLHGMWKMITERSDVRTLRYTVSPDNEASLHIVRNLGFALVGEQMDEEDGLELIYEMSVEEYLAKF
jgi:[ribosomal protein S5]-alanine N-acetyltransferase